MSFLPTFQAVCTEWGVAGDADVPEIDLAWLKYCEICMDRVDQMRADPDFPGTIEQLNQVLAESVIADHLGHDWVEKNILSPTTRQATGYLNLDATRVERLLSLHRVQELARRLFQLQSFAWFPSIVEKLRTRDLSGAAFELDVLWVLHIASVNVEATAESGTKGSDYDFSCIIQGRRIPVEAKAKDDSTLFSSNTVVSTLRTAARQLPKGEQGVVFLRIPPSWVSRELEEHYAEAVDEGIRGTSRVGAVITAIDKPHFTSERHGNVSRHFDYFRHPNCDEPIWTFAMMFKQAWDAEWTHWAPPAPF